MSELQIDQVLCLGLTLLNRLTKFCMSSIQFCEQIVPLVDLHLVSYSYISLNQLLSCQNDKVILCRQPFFWLISDSSFFTQFLPSNSFSSSRFIFCNNMVLDFIQDMFRKASKFLCLKFTFSRLFQRVSIRWTNSASLQFHCAVMVFISVRMTSNSLAIRGWVLGCQLFSLFALIWAWRRWNSFLTLCSLVAVGSSQAMELDWPRLLLLMLLLDSLNRLMVWNTICRILYWNKSMTDPIRYNYWCTIRPKELPPILHNRDIVSDIVPTATRPTRVATIMQRLHLFLIHNPKGDKRHHTSPIIVSTLFTGKPRLQYLCLTRIPRHHYYISNLVTYQSYLILYRPISMKDAPNRYRTLRKNPSDNSLRTDTSPNEEGSKYNKIPANARNKFMELVINRNYSIKMAARYTFINYSSAKSIISSFRLRSRRDFKVKVPEGTAASSFRPPRLADIQSSQICISTSVGGKLISEQRVVIRDKHVDALGMELVFVPSVIIDSI